MEENNMRLGCSISAKDLHLIKVMKESGYDFVESRINQFYDMTDGELDAFCAELKKYDYKCEAVNCLFPKTMKVIGADADMKVVEDYLNTVIPRTAPLYGYEVVVFGSGLSRHISEDFPYEKGVEQTAYICSEFLVPLAKKYGFKVALEELNGGETNFMNYVTQAYDIAKLINKPEIGIVCDSFHIALTGEGYNVLETMGDKIVHAHTANPVEREYPKIGDGHRYELFIESMRKAGYDGRVTVESFIEDELEPRIRQSAQLFKQLL